MSTKLVLFLLATFLSSAVRKSTPSVHKLQPAFPETPVSRTPPPPFFPLIECESHRRLRLRALRTRPQLSRERYQEDHPEELRFAHLLREHHRTRQSGVGLGQIFRGGLRALLQNCGSDGAPEVHEGRGQPGTGHSQRRWVSSSREVSNLRVSWGFGWFLVMIGFSFSQGERCFAGSALDHETKCVQKFHVIKLLTVNTGNDTLEYRDFKVPTTCVCTYVQDDE